MQGYGRFFLDYYDPASVASMKLSGDGHSDNTSPDD
jgi:hypothetical protein